MKIKLSKRVLLICGVIVILAAISIWLLFKPTYTVDKVLNMRPVWDVADNIVSSPTDKIFATSLYNLGYTTFLHGKGPYTVFVPTDKAYRNLPLTTKGLLAKNENSPYIRQVLLYHVVKGLYRYSDLRDGMTLKTVEGENLKFTKKGNYWVINGYSYIQTYDVMSKNGVIHIVTNYLLPPSLVGE
ncbi:MAG: fasciclin domain-containing protein [Candidatus Levyibacteriota bacterium]